MITDVWQLGVAETCLHWAIDFMKCENKINPHVDQFLHFLCKVIYILYILATCGGGCACYLYP